MDKCKDHYLNGICVCFTCRGNLVREHKDFNEIIRKFNDDEVADKTIELAEKMPYTCVYDFIDDHPTGASIKEIQEALGLKRAYVMRILQSAKNKTGKKWYR